MYISQSIPIEPFETSVRGYTRTTAGDDDHRVSVSLGRSTLYLSVEEAMWLSDALAQSCVDTEQESAPGWSYYIYEGDPALVAKRYSDARSGRTK